MVYETPVKSSAYDEMVMFLKFQNVQIKPHNSPLVVTLFSCGVKHRSITCSPLRKQTARKKECIGRVW